MQKGLWEQQQAVGLHRPLVRPRDQPGLLMTNQQEQENMQQGLQEQQQGVGLQWPLVRPRDPQGGLEVDKAEQGLQEQQQGLGLHRRLVRPRGQPGLLMTNQQELQLDLLHRAGSVGAIAAARVFGNETYCSEGKFHR